MIQFLNHSDIKLIRSAQYAKCFVRGTAQTSPPSDAWPATNRADRAWFADRNLQTLRPTHLPLRGRTWARPQAISVHNCSNRRAPAAWLRSERSVSPSREVPGQLPSAAGDAQRNLRDQCRTFASPRGSRLDGSGRRSSRLRQGGRHPRQHDRILSCWRRPAVHHGGSRS
jgi:hypothetical protein